MTGRSPSGFNRKLTQVVAARLERGQDRASLLAELESRLGRDEAAAILDRVEAAAPRADPRRPAGRLETVVRVAACAWAALLVLQNLGVVSGARSILGGGSPLDHQSALATSIAVGGVVKIGLLAVTAALFLAGRSRARFLTFAAAIIYAYPAGLFIEAALTPNRSAPEPRIFWTGGAILSYAAAAALIVLWRKASERPDPTPIAEQFR